MLKIRYEHLVDLKSYQNCLSKFGTINFKTYCRKLNFFCDLVRVNDISGGDVGSPHNLEVPNQQIPGRLFNSPIGLHRKSAKTNIKNSQNAQHFINFHITIEGLALRDRNIFKNK